MFKVINSIFFVLIFQFSKSQNNVDTRKIYDSLMLNEEYKLAMKSPEYYEMLNKKNSTALINLACINSYCP